MTQEQPPSGIETKLTALLTIAVDQYLRETGIARTKPRSIDKMLADVGVSAKEIAGLLGKTERAVHMVLASEAQKKQKSDKGASTKPQKQDTGKASNG